MERWRGRDRDVVYLRRRVALDPAEAWARLRGSEGLGGLRAHEPFIDEPPLQWAAVLDGSPGIARLGSEPVLGQSDAVDVTLWLAAYDGDGDRIDAIRRDWSALLERLYPEGETV